MKKRILCFFLIITGSICLAAAGTSVQAQQQELSDKLVRLHVIAASDSPEDQTLKLAVRDAVLEVVSQLEFENRDQAVLQLGSCLDRLCNTALSVLEAAGKPEKVTATLCREPYPTRLYDTFSLPSGEYVSLKITIGEGNGQNWWCVVYPAICVPASCETFSAEAASAGLSRKEVRLITADTPQIKLKFKFLELLQTIQKSLQDT